MTQVGEFIYSSVDIPSDWSEYRRLIRKPMVILTSISEKTGHKRTQRLPLLRAWLEAKRKQYQQRYRYTTFYIQPTKS